LAALGVPRTCGRRGLWFLIRFPAAVFRCRVFEIERCIQLLTGTITYLVESRGYGFIAVPGDVDVFFHCRDLPSELPFDEQLIERRVSFELVHRDGKARAARIRPCE
jgi:cold shock CspA family protein